MTASWIVFFYPPEVRFCAVTDRSTPRSSLSLCSVAAALHLRAPSRYEGNFLSHAEAAAVGDIDDRRLDEVNAIVPAIATFQDSCALMDEKGGELLA